MNKISYVNIFEFISRFEKILINDFKLLPSSFPIFQKFDYNYDLINFDNRKNYNVYQIKENFDANYLEAINLLSNNSNYNGIYFKHFLINRNIEINQSNDIIEEYYDLCFKIKQSEIINYENFVIELEKKILNIFNIKLNNIETKDFSKYNKNFNFFDINDYLYQYVHNKKFVNAMNVRDYFINNNLSKIYNHNLTVIFLYWYESQKNVLPLISFNVLSKENDNLNCTPFVRVRIYFSKLLMVYFNLENIFNLYD